MRASGIDRIHAVSTTSRDVPVTLPSMIVQAEFPPEAFGRVISLLLSINQFTFAFGPAILGALRDWWGDYGAAFALCLGLQVIAAIVVLAGRPRR